MKISDILKKAEEIEKEFIVIRPETKTRYGICMRMKGDPNIEIIKFQKNKNAEFNLYGKQCSIHSSISFDIDIAQKIIKTMQYLLDKEI